MGLRASVPASGQKVPACQGIPGWPNVQPPLAGGANQPSSSSTVGWATPRQHRGLSFGRRPTMPQRLQESETGCCLEGHLLWATTCMQGWRQAMEDAHVARVGALPDGSGEGDWARTGLFGVFDGHGGSQVARFCEMHLPAVLASLPSHDVPAALYRSFLEMDLLLQQPGCYEQLRMLGRGSSPHPGMMGAAAIVSCIRDGMIYVANAGDCRAVLCRGGVAVDMSQDHKPDHPVEAARIRAAGGFVSDEGVGRPLHRVNGGLSLSRAIGDLRYKQQVLLPPEAQIISGAPDVRTFKRQRGDEFMVLACDGVWDVFTSQQVVDFFRPSIPSVIAGEEKLSNLTAELLNRCMSPDPIKTMGAGSDNMSVVVVIFTESLLEQEANPAVLPFLLGCQGCARLGKQSWLCPTGKDV